MTKDLNEYSSAVENLKARLKAMQITYADVAQGIGMSESGVKKIFTGSDGSFQRIAQICRFLGVSMAQIMEPAPSDQDEFTTAQQQAFTTDPELFSFYWLLVQERASQDIAEKFLRLTKGDGARQLRQLDELGFLKLLPDGRVVFPPAKIRRLSVEDSFSRKMIQEWSQRFVAKMTAGPTKEGEIFALRYLQMLPKTYAEFLRAQRELENEFSRRAEREMREENPRSEAPTRLQNVRWLTAIDQKSFVRD